MKRQETLEEAIELTTSKRDDEYGAPGANGLVVSRMWSAYLGFDIKPHDVFMLMALMKIARTKHSPQKADHYYDIAGYAACASEVVNSRDPSKEKREGALHPTFDPDSDHYDAQERFTS